ncbi:2Fe-2S iron-sulfur cluster-binding protein [Nonomuraea sp. NPDC050310]|uniref:2Fe-2S iron-sulfur cluster-binding protein n=1 Tax=Nonomuraea sp. NPDC050310 TaxID=3154935 RepID=UPI0033DA56E7
MTTPPTLAFRFDGVPYSGLPGDTLAAALLRNGVRVVGHSVDLGRPRGVYTAGPEEPNALVRVGADPMLPATTIELREGLEAWSLRGKGRIDPSAPDSRRCDKAYLHCDVLVIGGGPAGLAAALAAGSAGARVVLLDEGPRLGGDLLSSRVLLDGAPAARWAGNAEARLRELPEVRILTRTTATGYYDHNYVLAVSRPTPEAERLWHLRARRVVLATGAHERPIAFPGNDRPGVMLASAARTYANRYGVAPGRRALVFACADSGHEAARDLAAAGVEIVAVVDPRADGQLVTGTTADAAGVLDGVLIGDRHVEADLLAVAGGWNPVVHLFSQSQGRLRFDDELQTFVPHLSAQAERSAGACRGVYGSAEAIADGLAAGAEAAALTGYGAPVAVRVPDSDQGALRPPARLWTCGDDPATAFADLHRDVTVADLARAVGAGLRSPEHVKRFTTAGTGADQGKTSIVAGVLGALLGVTPAATTFRPPYTPVSFATLAGRDRGLLSDPVRVTAMHGEHVARGAVFEDVGQWKRPWYFPRPGESMAEAVARERLAARTAVAAMDASTLGKIDIRGRDAGEFLDRIYTNLYSTLPVGSCRYGVMCGADGMVFDDGVTTRLGAEHYLMTTTTGNAAAVLDWLEEWHQTEWPQLDVRFVSVTDHWATVAVAGPRARRVIRALAPEAAELAFMTYAETAVLGVPGRVFRISFSGELAFEVNVHWQYGGALWRRVLELGAVPYGTETMHVLRAEKGFAIVGQETDGTVTPQDLGMGWIVSRRKPDFVGRRSHLRPDTARESRKRLVGLVAEEPVPEGAQLTREGAAPAIGYVTSSYPVAVLALVREAAEGERLVAVDGARRVPVTVVSPVFYDPDNLRRDGDPEPDDLHRDGDPEAGELADPVDPESGVLEAVSPAAGFAGRFAAASGARVRVREVPFVPMWEVRGEDPGRGLRLGPAWWLVVGGEAPAGGVEVSGQRTVLELSGPAAREVLMTGCPLDLHPRVFTGHAQTTVGKAGVVLERTEPDTYRLYVRSSFAAYLAEWLLDALDGI